ncbi:uncharacterized protein TNCV_4933011 [Trichonephila clavipes]|nr:uncharacterized protein TNCV_4933011 [Trichonephila clavipes]
MPQVKRRNHSAQMNSKRWCSDSVNTCVTEENILDPNIRIKQLLSTEKTGHSEVGNFIIVSFEQISKIITKLKCPECDKQTLKLALGNKVEDGTEKGTLKSKVHSEVRKAYEAPTDVPVVDISVSFDGSWLTRGHTSLIGIACIIDILTGYVIDFEVMYKVWRNCSVAKRELGESSAEYDIWLEGHRKDCDINHSGSSTSMEMEAALIIWERSQEMGFLYSTLLSDGDCKTFNYLTEKNVYGDKFEIKKEECINHVSKRLGTGLRNAVNESRARGISLGGKGHGTLKEATIKKLTLYYQKAIVQNTGNVRAMKKQYICYFTSQHFDRPKPQRSKCPIGADSWCFYQSAKAKGQNPDLQKCVHVNIYNLGILY